MDGLEESRPTVMKSGNNIRWGTLILAFIGLIVISYGFVYLLQFIDLSEFPLYDYSLAAYLAVFLTSLIANLTIIAPVPFALVIVITAATKFNPWIIALCAATGGTIGEMSGYYAGRLGKKIAIPDSIVAYHKIEGWVNKYGFWAIMLLAFQPIIPFDIGGLVAGTAKMPLFYFLPALWLGKFPKYLLFAFAGVGVINFLPGWLLP